MPLYIVRNDIVNMTVDAIVNAANHHLKKGGGVCGSIFEAAGSSELTDECNHIGYCETGQAVLTSGYHLKAKYIIHTVGPVYRDGSHHEAALLEDSYRNSLLLAREHHLTSIAFPLISSGSFLYPKKEALDIATAVIEQFLQDNEMTVYLAVYDKESFTISQKLSMFLNTYIDDQYINECTIIERSYQKNSYKIDKSANMPRMAIIKRKDIPLTLEETFSERLLYMIDAKGLTDSEAYKKANIDRKLFSKIKSNKNYHPRKKTAIAFSIALELTLEETNELLSKAGYTLSRSCLFDVIIEFFITEKNYSIYEINETLFYYDQVLLGA